MTRAKEGSPEPKPRPTRARKKKTAEPTSRGLTAAQVAAQSPPAKVEKLQQAIEEVGGKVLGTYREPLGILPSRVTFVIDRAGIVRHVFSVLFSAERHVAEALEIVRELVREGDEPSIPQP